jgi:hypothetical protein
MRIAYTMRHVLIMGNTPIVAPSMETGIADHIWSLQEIGNLTQNQDGEFTI